MESLFSFQQGSLPLLILQFITQPVTQLILTKNLLTSLLPHDGVTSSITENSEKINSHEPASEKKNTFKVKTQV